MNGQALAIVNASGLRGQFISRWLESATLNNATSGASEAMSVSITPMG
jgi:hypothetical protein